MIVLCTCEPPVSITTSLFCRRLILLSLLTNQTNKPSVAERLAVLLYIRAELALFTYWVIHQQSIVTYDAGTHLLYFQSDWLIPEQRRPVTQGCHCHLSLSFSG